MLSVKPFAIANGFSFTMSLDIFNEARGVVESEQLLKILKEKPL